MTEDNNVTNLTAQKEWLTPDELFEEYKIRKCRYKNIFWKFLHGKFDKNELMKRMAEADKKEIDDGSIVYQVQMVDLESKEGKTARLVSVE